MSCSCFVCHNSGINILIRYKCGHFPLLFFMAKTTWVVSVFRKIIAKCHQKFKIPRSFKNYLHASKFPGVWMWVTGLPLSLFSEQTLTGSLQTTFFAYIAKLIFPPTMSAKGMLLPSVLLSYWLHGKSENMVVSWPWEKEVVNPWHLVALVMGFCSIFMCTTR